MDKSEYEATKETLDESKKLAQELEISLTELLLVRQLVQLRWLCLNKANEELGEKSSPSSVH